MVDVVLWDLGGVLCRFRPEARIRRIAGQAGCGAARVRSLLGAELLDGLDHGTID